MSRIIKFLIGSIVLMTFAAQVKASGPSGAWRGELNLGNVKLPLVFNFSVTESGVSRCTMDSPAQGAKGIPVEIALCTPDSIALTCNAIGASYNGRISAGVINGQFEQRGYKFPLDLTPEIPLEERRPQTPKPPFPYSVIDTTFTAKDGALMGATLTLPLTTSGRKMTAVVMVTGSGPQNRDEEIYEHKPFAVIADFLARNGIASLRYDDRGTAKSSGDLLTSDIYTFCDDAISAVDFARSLSCIDRVGVLGHSEGGSIAFMTGAEHKADFIISLAGMAISGKETVIRQNKHALDRMDMPEADKTNSLKLIEMVFDSIASRTGRTVSATVDVDALAAAHNIKVPEQIIQSLKMAQNNRAPWFDAFITFNPRDYLLKVKCPVLAINGDKDTQVYPDNLEVIKAAVPHAETLLMPGLNHLMQHAVTGEPTEYSQIRETISPSVLDAILRFLTSTTK